MATTVKEYVAERGIEVLVHFTRAKNLGSILTRGLVPRNSLILEGFNDYNDQHRYDGTDAVCLSIGFPNYKMFHGCKQDHKEESWVVIAIDPALLWQEDCAFCTTNAASNGVTSIPIEQRKGLAALQAMYGDWPSKPRDQLAIHAAYPTNPQAEVLALDGVARKYILGAFTASHAHQKEFSTKHPGVEFLCDPSYFKWRSDYAHWQ